MSPQLWGIVPKVVVVDVLVTVVVTEVLVVLVTDGAVLVVVTDAAVVEVVELVEVEVVVAHPPEPLQPSAVLVKAVHDSPFFSHLAAGTMLAFCVPFFFSSQQTTLPGLPHVEASAHFFAAAAHGPVSVPSRFACLVRLDTHFTYGLRVDLTSGSQTHSSAIRCAIASSASEGGHFLLWHTADAVWAAPRAAVKTRTA